MALALEVQRQVVEVVHHRVIEGALAKIVECHVELALPLECQAQHARVCRGGGVRCLFAALGHGKTLGNQQHVADHQQRQRPHELQPHALPCHQDEMRDEQQGGHSRRDGSTRAGRKPRQKRNQIAQQAQHSNSTHMRVGLT
jgi:hypothetical protein